MTLQGEEDIVLRLLHTADWHLGKRFPSFSEDQNRRLMQARLAVLDRIVAEAERFSVNAVLCSGDLFDDPVPRKEWWEPVAQLWTRLRWTNRPVFLLPGNHDPMLAESVWNNRAFRELLPSWVHVVDRPNFEFQLSDEAVLYAVPCSSKAGQRDPTDSIPERQPGDERIRIGMVHGSTFDMKDCQVNFPISKDAALRRGLDYLALGDTHGFRYVPPDRLHPPTIYPGAPEPTAFDEVDPGYVAVVRINRQRRAQVERRRVAYWTWEDRQVQSLRELEELAARTDLTDRVLRLRVSMKVSAKELERAESLLVDLGGSESRPGRVGLLALDRHGLELETSRIEEDCADLPEVLQSVVRRLKLEAEKPDRRRVAQRALHHLYRTAKGGA
ncbi:MAG: metallophosphoesterase [Pseudomonadota bacterium]|jgi:DNA repair exonuclease SbcCD nuclease subunit